MFLPLEGSEIGKSNSIATTEKQTLIENGKYVTKWSVRPLARTFLVLSARSITGHFHDASLRFSSSKHLFA